MTYLLSLSTARWSVLFSISLLLMTCSDSLPQPTRTGNYTFGCKINGKKWIPDGGTGFTPAKPISGGFFLVPSRGYETVINIYAVSKDGQRLGLYIDESKIGSFDLNFNTQPSPASLSPKSYGLYRATDGNEYITSSRNTGKIVITRADTLSGIISGTFFFTAGNNSGDKISTTEGRFDYVRKR